MRILRSLARTLLRHGIPIQSFVDLAKLAYVDVAVRDFALPGRKASISRVSLLTGLTRKEVQRLVDDQLGAEPGADRQNRAARVVASWVRDPLFQNAQGEPAALPFDGADHSFAELVRRYSGDVPPRAVLDELLRVGCVERSDDGRLHLLSRVYLPRKSDAAKIAILGVDVSYLIDTIEHNLVDGEASPRFQRKVVYDNLPREAIEAFRAMSSDQSQALIERLDAWLATHDRDANPLARGTGRMRAGIGIFYFEEDLSETKGASS